MIEIAGIKVLLIDSSILHRDLILGWLKPSLPPGSELFCVADGIMQKARATKFAPDVILLYSQLPPIAGLELLKKIAHEYKLPLVYMSSDPCSSKGSRVAGAHEFIEQPLDYLLPGNTEFFEKLSNSLYAAAAPRMNKLAASDRVTKKMRLDLIAIGSSTGGTEALTAILTPLKPPLPGIIITQHIPPNFSRMFAASLDKATAFTCKEAATGDIIEQNHVYVAEGKKHLRIKKRDDGRYELDCSAGEKVNGHCPSADVMFSSVAEVAGDKALGVILTGMGGDGAKGLLKLRQTGAPTLGQDEASCVVYGMPKVAFELGAVQRQLSLKALPAVITDIARGW